MLRKLETESPWLQLLGGGAFIVHSCSSVSFQGPQPTLLDVSMALAKVNRYTGNTKFPISVAQHSLMMADQCGDNHMLALACLAHDVAECVLGDPPGPFRKLHGEAHARAVKTLEAAVESLLFPLFDLPKQLSPEVKAFVKNLDRRAQATEHRDLMVHHFEWSMLKGVEPFKAQIEELHWREAARRFHLEVQHRIDCRRVIRECAA